MSQIIKRLLPVIALGLVLAACATEAPYGPKALGQSYGYTDQRLGENRYRVTYTGSTATSRETVENYLLRRAAEVTLDSGYDYFVFDIRDTKRDTRYYDDFVGWPGWRGGLYWHSWAFGPPFPEETEIRAVTRFKAYSEIVMLKGAQAASEPRALNARDVIARLSPPHAP